ncbi:MAG: VWA domain-containing protein [Oscillospiraceae bacterium]|nr:VWA domain-containing protein [Oscillospiraceae bacterium]
MKNRRIAPRRLLILILSLALCLAVVSPAFAADSGSQAESAPESTQQAGSGNVRGTALEISSSVDNEEFDLILLIDRSGSMKNTDRSKLVQDSARMVVDLCEEGRNSRIAVMSFDTVVYNSGFLSLGDEVQREMVKKEISAIDYMDGGTDVGLALSTAVDYIVSESEPAHKRMILLFTDGYTQDLVGKDLQESEAELQQALEKAAKNDCRIFTIGTNYNGSMREDGRQALEGIRDYQIAHGVEISPEELLNIVDAKDQDGMKAVVTEFEKMYATIGKRIIHEGNIVVESSNVSEVNIIISAPEGISEAVVTAPSGSTAVVDLNGRETTLDGARIVYKSGKAYQLIKIIEPISVGTWLLNVADNQSEPILNYTWMLTSKAEITMTLEQKNNKTAVITVQPKGIDSESIKDFYNSLTSKGVVITKSGDDGESLSKDLTFNLDEFRLKASFEVEPARTYTVTASVSDGYFVRSCTGTLEIPEVWTGPNEEKDFGTIYAWKWFSKTVDLAEQFGKGLRELESVDGENGLAEFEVDGTIIKLKSLRTGSGEIRFKGILADGTEVDLTGDLKVLNPLIPLFILLAVIAAIVVLLRLKRKKRMLMGSFFFNFNVALSEEGEYKVPEVFVPRRPEFSLYELMEAYRGDVLDDSWRKTIDRTILNKKSAYYLELRNAKFSVCPDEQSFKHNDTVYKRHNTQFAWVSEDEQVRVSFTY